MTTPTTSPVTATVREDGTGEITLDGVPTSVSSDSGLAGARTLVLERARAEARRLGRPVTLVATDPVATFQMVVQVEGQVTDYRQVPDAVTVTEPGAADSGEPASTTPVGPMAGHRSARPARAARAPRRNPAHDFQPGSAMLTPPDELGLAAVHAPATPTKSLRLDDLLATRPQPRPDVAEWGWQAGVRRATGGLIKPSPGVDELRHRKALVAVQRSLDGPKTIAVINPKGGAIKTTAALLMAATFGEVRGGYTLAWDNNETRGTMGWRAEPTRHTNSATDLLRELHRFESAGSSVGDLANFVRTQTSARFDVLASDEDPASAASIGAEDFERLRAVAARFYRVIVVDTGNNMRAANWRAAVEAADQLVIVSSVREDTAQSAAWLADALEDAGHADKLRNAVTVLSAAAQSSSRQTKALRGHLLDHFMARTRVVRTVPFDRALVDGGPIHYDRLSAASREAWLQVTAAVADGL